MAFSVVIPARYASTRLPGKALADIGGKPMVEHVVDRANESSASRVIVATDDQRIAEALSRAQCEVCMTRPDHVSGSDRLAEVVKLLDLPDAEIVVNVQGDEPMIPPRLIDQLASSLDHALDAPMATAARQISDPQQIADPNIVKVVFNRAGQALYFSRAGIPFARDGGAVDVWHHIGIYAYRAGFLRTYPDIAVSSIEQAESLEQLRVLDNGDAIMVERVDYETGIGVDTPQDLEEVRALFDK